MEAATERIGQLDAQIEPMEAFEQRSQAHRASTNRFTPARNRPASDDDRDQGERSGGGEQRAGLGVRAEPREQYRSAGEFMADYLVARGIPEKGIKADERAQERVQAAMQTRIVHQTTEDTPGLLPKNVIGAINNDLDASRPFVASVGVRDLGAIPGRTFLRPYVTQHTQVGKQSAEKAELPSRQLKIDSKEFAKETFGGALNVSRQDIDWTSPSAWDAILSDLQAQYGIYTEDVASEVFQAGVQRSVNLGAEDFRGWIAAMYAAAVVAMRDHDGRPSALRMPNHVWVSPDMWGTLGAIKAELKADSAGAGIGNTDAGSFTSSFLDFGQTMVPGFEPGTVIVGRKNLFEFYEQRIGLLQAIEPKVLGVEIAYGGYCASGFMDDSAFVQIAGAPPVAG